MVFDSLETILWLPELNSPGYSYIDYSYIDCIDRLYQKRIDFLSSKECHDDTLVLEERLADKLPQEKSPIILEEKISGMPDICNDERKIRWAKILRWKTKKARMLVNTAPSRYEVRRAFAKQRKRIGGRFV